MYDLAVFEKSADKVELRVEDYERYMQAGGHFKALIAEVDEAAVGMAIYYNRFSTWVGDYLHLEDLYVKPEYRGRGVAKQLITTLGDTALGCGMKRMEWLVLDWNKSAIRLYEHLGAAVLPDWRLCMADEDALVYMTAPSKE